MDLDTPFIIPVFIPHWGCPHQCLFCNQSSITGVSSRAPTPEIVDRQIQRFLGFKGDKRNHVEIAFFGGNFLGLSIEMITALLDAATRYVKNGAVNSIRFSTRPDTIDKARLDRIADFPVSTIELGVQSMDDHVLALSNRGHSARDTETAVALLKERNFDMGLQMMVGLPGDDGRASIMTAQRISSLSPDFVRIYPTVVLRGSPLARRFRDGDYKPIALEKCVTLVKDIYHIFQSRCIRVVRMGLQASGDLEGNASILAGPYHPCFGHLVYSEIFLDMAAARLKKTKQGYDNVVIKVNPRNLSRMRGMKNHNLRALEKAFKIRSLDVLPDENVKGDQLIIETGDFD